MEETLKAIDKVNIQTVVFWPNSDAGTNEVAKAIRVYREKGQLKNQKIRFVTDLLPEDFIALLRRSSALIGNSSAGIKESSVLGVPVINVGSRQNNRLRGENVLDVGYDANDIKKAIEKQLAHGKYPVSKLYFQPKSSQKIVEVLSKIKLSTQKKFHE